MAVLKRPKPDGSRDPRIEDPTNLWIIHPAGRALLPVALRAGISANTVSIVGLLAGAAAASSYLRFADWRMATAGFLLSVAWLIADGLDGMIARATKSASALGRFLDGVCDHGVFLLLYLALAAAVGTPEGWTLGIIAGLVHAVQASLYEGERARFHKRIRGESGQQPFATSANPLVRLYDSVAGSMDRLAEPFDRLLGSTQDRAGLGEHYGAEAAPAMKLLSLLSNNVRVIVIYIACLAGDPAIFWWFELVVLSAIAAIGILWHRRVEARLIRDQANRYCSTVSS